MRQVPIARLVAFHSLPIAPTRRLALDVLEPIGGGADEHAALLAAGVLRRWRGRLEESELAELTELLQQLRAGARVVQPRVRHRLQADQVGLKRCEIRLTTGRSGLSLDLSKASGTPLQQSLMATYAAATLGEWALGQCIDALAVRSSLAEFLSGERPAIRALPTGSAMWAAELLGLDPLMVHSDAAVMSAFRSQLRLAHPDGGGSASTAADRIGELSEARHVLLARLHA